VASVAELKAAAQRAGFTGEALDIIVAIARAESGGRVDAVGDGGNSVGALQVHLPSHPQYDRQRMLTDLDYAFQAAFEISGGGSNFNAWTTWSGRTAAGKANDARRFLGEAASTAPAAGGGFVADDDGLASDASPEEIRTYIERNMPEMAYLLDIPEVADVVVGWVRDDAPDEDLAPRIRQTAYYRTNAPSARQWDQMIVADPALAGVTLMRKMGEVGRAFSQHGEIFLTPEEQWSIADQAIRGGWDEADLNRFIVERFRTKGQTTLGARLGADEIQATAKKYGLPMSRQTAEEWATQMQLGVMNEDGFENYLRDQTRFWWADHPNVIKFVEGGGTPADYFSPLKDTIADTLELNPADIDVFDPQWRQVTDFVDEAGARRSMTPNEARKFAMKDDRVKQTQWYQQTKTNWAGTLGRTFDVIPGG
jgi:hypothetical protein